MKLSDFDYNYPEELVAQQPLASRDASRMMVVDRKTNTIRHSRVAELDTVLREGDLLVVNDSRVIPARLFGQRKNGEKIELLIIEASAKQSYVWRCLLKRARRMRSGDQFFFGMHAKAKVVGRDDSFLLVEFKNNALDLAMKYHGVPPLPPYIKREGIKSYTKEDRDRYQTVYAHKPGSAAAPTAGLHLSHDLMCKLQKRGILIEKITLHVGIDTFMPVRESEVSRHRMHGERIEISRESADAINSAKKDGRRIVAVGTTTVRALESATQNDTVKHGSCITDLYILPGYKFQTVDVLLTNFHQPRSTLLMMVSAFAGREFIIKCYNEAIQEKYRLFSYGDCMLIV